MVLLYIMRQNEALKTLSSYFSLTEVDLDDFLFIMLYITLEFSILFTPLFNVCLFKSSANPLVINDDCQTPLDVARAKGYVNVVRAIEVFLRKCSSSH